MTDRKAGRRGPATTPDATLTKVSPLHDGPKDSAEVVALTCWARRYDLADLVAELDPANVAADDHAARCLAGVVGPEVTAS